MFNFPASDFVTVSSELKSAESVLRFIQRGHPVDKLGANDPIGSSMVSETASRLARLETSIGSMPTPLSKIAISRLKRGLADSMTFSELHASLASLHGRLRDELSLLHCFVLRPEAKLYFEDGIAFFGQDVASAFPSAAYDIVEAGKCLALQRSTAAVTHLMRALELGLVAMARKFDVKSDREQWNGMIEGIEKRIESANAATHGIAWRDERDFYSSAAAHFRLLKNGWRNHAMHVRAKYTEEEAEEIYRSVKAFFRHLSQRLSEQPENTGAA